LVDEKPAHDAQQPAVRLIQAFELVEARVSPYADLLHEILGIVDRPRETVRGSVKQVVMPPDQGLEALGGGLAARNDRQFRHEYPVNPFRINTFRNGFGSFRAD